MEPHVSMCVVGSQGLFLDQSLCASYLGEGEVSFNKFGNSFNVMNSCSQVLMLYQTKHGIFYSILCTAGDRSRQKDPFERNSKLGTF